MKTPNPKCGLFLKIDQDRYLAAVVYLSEAPFPPDPILPPNTLYTCVHCTVYLFTQGRGGEPTWELTKEKVRGAMLHKAGRKYQHD